MTEIPVAAAVLVACFALIVVQEAVHGFHDCANAIAPTVATNALAPRFAIPLAGACNFLGIVVGGTAVVFELIYLLPTGMIAGIDNRNEVAFLLSIVATIVAWNLAAWWLAIPNATTHSYVGAMLGAATAYADVYHSAAEGVVFWDEGAAVLTALFVSPVIGFLLAAIVFAMLRLLAGKRPLAEAAIPGWQVRSTLITGSAAVSFMHGSNDGQKSIALMMLVLIGLAPEQYGFDRHPDSAEVAALRGAAATFRAIGERYGHVLDVAAYSKALTHESADLAALLDKGPVAELPRTEQVRFRDEVIRVQRAVNAFITDGIGDGVLSAADRDALRHARRDLDHYIEAVPWWVTLVSALAFAIGGAIGYRRIVRTIASGIGKSEIGTREAIAAQLTAVACIALGDTTQMPVSTTQVVSSGIAGGLAAGGRRVRFGVARNIVVAWIVTLPATMATAYVLGLAAHRVIS